MLVPLLSPRDPRSEQLASSSTRPSISVPAQSAVNVPSESRRTSTTPIGHARSHAPSTGASAAATKTPVGSHADGAAIGASENEASVAQLDESVPAPDARSIASDA